MTVKITWKRNDIGGISSIDGRFAISPNYRHTVNPDSWSVYDKVRHRTVQCDKQKEAKEAAETILEQEAEHIGAWGFERPDPQHDQHVIRWSYMRPTEREVNAAVRSLSRAQKWCD